MVHDNMLLKIMKDNYELYTLPFSLGVLSTQSPTRAPNSRTLTPMESPYMAVTRKSCGEMMTRKSPTPNPHMRSP